MRKGFTLIELLAVIIILAIVALIATPIVLDVVNDAKKSGYLSSAYGVMDTAKLYYTESIFDEEKQVKLDGQTNLLDELVINGDKPDSGEVYINGSGRIAMAIIYNNTCYSKTFEESTLTESEDIDNCKISDNASYSVGNIVKLTTGNDTASEWYVIEDSSSTSSTVKLLKATNIDDNTYAFDEAGNRNAENSTLCVNELASENASQYEEFGGCAFSIYSKYDGEKTFEYGLGGVSTGTVTVDSTIKQNVDTYGNSLGLGSNLVEIRLLLDSEYNTLNGNEWINTTNYWLDIDSELRSGPLFDTCVVANGSFMVTMANSTKYGIRPVIVVSKTIVE